ncbi:MAG: hypothetical protein JWM53_2974 [bacterium]|nr:hypothetical protein [bacterium]
MRGSRIIAIIALVAAIAAITLAAALKHQQNERRARVHQLAH